MSGSSRLSSLDGLRGAAALIVVVHHCFLVSPAFAAAYYGGETGDSPLRLALIYSPLHLLWGGAEAVVVFFVLSGFVLARGIRSSSFDWFAYFPSRVLRLYVPVAGAVVLGFVLLLVPHAGGPDSPWLQRDASDYDLGSMLQDLTLVGGTSGVVSPLWSLRWEVIFSLLLPVIAYAARVIPAWLFGVLCIVLSAVGAGQESAAMQYLPIFGVGVALEGEWGRIERLIGGLSRWGRTVLWGGMLPLAVVLLSMRWLLPPSLDHSVLVAAAQAPIVLGAALLVVMAAQWAPLSSLLSWRPIGWLGTISFSLYLVHEPFVLLMASATGASRWTLLTAVPLALVAAWLFWRVVERPAHKLSRGVRERAREKKTVMVENPPAVVPERERELIRM
ncbi:acyltransferase [Microbacterium horticulturae]|uniref:Acyltransferase n=1 Tax=Microbacterium horticulturae TaxID=3028316 RepID=A0ABY8C2F2_9MICO|nr:acyltransferase [Microbacterium sp. KACC 23027]WEG10475.1 acyltransferase [Microbacterium sp. KACC 23027]